MSVEQWRQLEQIYHGALEREPYERARFIAEACGGNKELRRKIESLLVQDLTANNFWTIPLGKAP